MSVIQAFVISYSIIDYLIDYAASLTFLKKFKNEKHSFQKAAQTRSTAIQV